MDCNETKYYLDDYIDGLLSANELRAVDGHLEHCKPCQQAFARARQLQEALATLPAPSPRAGFLDSAFDKATQPARRSHQSRWLGIGGAMAAGFALLFIVNQMYFTTPGLPHGELASNDIPGLSITLNQTRNVNLVFNSSYALNDATFTVLLPEGIALEGYPDQREIKWQGQLREGKNLLTLPLIASNMKGGEVVTYVEHINKRKAFKLRMDVIEPKHSDRQPGFNGLA